MITDKKNDALMKTSFFIFSSELEAHCSVFYQLFSMRNLSTSIPAVAPEPAAMIA